MAKETNDIVLIGLYNRMQNELSVATELNHSKTSITNAVRQLLKKAIDQQQINLNSKLVVSSFAPPAALATPIVLAGPAASATPIVLAAPAALATPIAADVATKLMIANRRDAVCNMVKECEREKALIGSLLRALVYVPTQHTLHDVLRAFMKFMVDFAKLHRTQLDRISNVASIFSDMQKRLR